MSDRQDQRVAENAIAVQSGGDTTINQGVTTEEIKAIVEGLSDQLPRMAAVAAAVVEERLKSFKEEVIRRFETDGSTKRQAFEDPDFIEVVAEAQRNYARTSKADAHKTLVDLIAERSKRESGERISHVLNEAVSVTSKLTSSELDELGLTFLIRHIRSAALVNLQGFGAYHQALFSDLINNVETDISSYNYLVAQRCASISIGSISLVDCWRRAYPGFFMKGVAINHYRSLVGNQVSDSTLFVNSLFDRNGLQPNAVYKDVFDNVARSRGLTTTVINQIWDIATNNLADDESIIRKVSPLCPLLKDVNEKWNNSPLQSLELTALGLAIGHTRMSQIPAASKSDISIWVQ